MKMYKTLADYQRKGILQTCKLNTAVAAFRNQFSSHSIEILVA